MLKEAIYSFLKDNGPSTIHEIEKGIQSDASEFEILHDINVLINEEKIKSLTLQDNIDAGFSDSHARFMINS